MAMWNPWRGCKKCSDGCLHCYTHKGDFKRNVNTNDIVKTKDFEIIDYKKYKIRQYYNIIYVYITFKVRKYFIINGKIKRQFATQTVRLMENKNVITNTSENIEKCISCGASVDLSKKECEYCGTRTPSPNEWILDYRYIK